MHLFRIVKLVLSGLSRIAKEEIRQCEKERAHQLYLIMKEEFDHDNKL